jgi:CheY-like chemotaxis protein
MWVARRWFGRGSFQCEQCGDFPDFGGPSSSTLYGREVLATSPGAVPKTSRRTRVLLVDDSDEHRDLYALMLEDRVTVITASRGESALALAAADPPDVIVLDVMMPGMDGWEVCRRLKVDPRTASVPIVMLTSLDAVDVPARAREAGAVAVLMKPCPIERLLLTLTAAIDRGDRSSPIERHIS